MSFATSLSSITESESGPAITLNTSGEEKKMKKGHFSANVLRTRLCLPSNFTHCEVYPVPISRVCFVYSENMVNKHGRREQETNHSNLAFTLSGHKIYCSNFPRREFEHFLCFYYNFFCQNTRRSDERGGAANGKEIYFSVLAFCFFMICRFRSEEIQFIEAVIWLKTLILILLASQS